MDDRDKALFESACRIENNLDLLGKKVSLDILDNLYRCHGLNMGCLAPNAVYYPKFSLCNSIDWEVPTVNGEKRDIGLRSEECNHNSINFLSHLKDRDDAVSSKSSD